jgi:hypothetical protein
VISRAFLLVGTSVAALYLVLVARSYRPALDERIALVFAVKLVLVYGLALHFALAGHNAVRGWFERAVDFCERNPRAVLAGMIIATAALASLTTPQIGFGGGLLGLGYGHDGAIYGLMTEQFGAFEGRIVGQWGHRFLPPMLVHYSGLDTFTGFRVLNLTSHGLAAVLLYRIARALGLMRSAALLAVVFFSTLKFGLKFLVYYPVNTDGLGALLLMAIIWATLEKRHLVYTLAMVAAVATRENLLALMPFHALHLIRTGSGTGRFVAAVLPQIPALAAYWLSRKYPVFPGVVSFPAWMAVKMGATQFVQSAASQQRLLLAYLNAVGVPLILLALAWRRAVVALGARYEWAYLVAVSLALSVVGGSDLDRFATWLAPAAILGVLALYIPRRGPVPRIWMYWLLIHVSAMEFFLPWFPEEPFYLSRYAAHAPGVAYTYIAVFSWALIAAVMALQVNDTDPEPCGAGAAAHSGVSPTASSTSR